jgi:hypothetical protein
VGDHYYYNVPALLHILELGTKRKQKEAQKNKGIYRFRVVILLQAF